MSTHKQKSREYELKDSTALNYQRMEFDTPETAQKVVEEYEESTEPSLMDYVVMLAGYGDITPIVAPNQENEVIVSRDKTDDLKEIADKVLEE